MHHASCVMLAPARLPHCPREDCHEQGLQSQQPSGSMNVTAGNGWLLPRARDLIIHPGNRAPVWQVHAPDNGQPGKLLSSQLPADPSWTRKREVSMPVILDRPHPVTSRLHAMLAAIHNGWKPLLANWGATWKMHLSSHEYCVVAGRACLDVVCHMLLS